MRAARSVVWLTIVVMVIVSPGMTAMGNARQATLAWFPRQSSDLDRDGGSPEQDLAPRGSGQESTAATTGEPGLGSRALAAAIPLVARTKIEPDLLEQLLDSTQAARLSGVAQPQPVTYLVYMRDQSLPLTLSGAAGTLARRESLVSGMQREAERSQLDIRRYLDSEVAAHRVAGYRSYWIFNGLAVDGGLDTAVALAQRPDVESIRLNHTHQLPLPRSDAEAETTLDAVNVAWGVDRIGADRVWESLGITGEGMVVANIDSGVDWTHPALQAKYRGYNPVDPAASSHEYNWFDPTGTYPNAPGPNRPHLSAKSDHGTHAMGTMVGASPDGQQRIGVAPGAQWVAVKAFDDNGEATDEWIHAAFQWCLAPTDLQGRNPDPQKAPNIVSNSWGDEHGQDRTFWRDVLALRGAGILTVFAAGNEGPNPSTVDSPASFAEAFAVGATDQQDRIWTFSSRGPSPWLEIKPEVVAPGVGIRSSIAGGGYEDWSGTSMATPHVGGLAALLGQANRSLGSVVGLSITATQYIITSTAVDLGQPGEDNDYGFGRADAYQAVSTMLRAGTLFGVVSDGQTVSGLPGATLTLRNLGTGGQAQATTQADGYYEVSVASGTYDVTVAKFGYQTSVAPSVPIAANTRTRLDVPLRSLPLGTIRGRVTCEPSGTPLPATVSLVGTPASTMVDAQGFYTLSVPAGTYTVRAMPAELGYRGSQVGSVTVAAGATVTVNRILTPAPRLLLVHADAKWVPARQSSYWSSALDELLYRFDSYSVYDPPADNPTAAKLAQYDLVLWSQPETSPGYTDAWRAIEPYLAQGGRLLISGQNVGRWDSTYAADKYARLLHSRYLDNNAGSYGPVGVSLDILDGVTLSYNTSDSAQNQTSPDRIDTADALARPILTSASSAILGLRADGCDEKVVYLSFGLEGIGPDAMRVETLGRSVSWLHSPRPPTAIGLLASPSGEAVPAGREVSRSIVLVNDGTQPDRYQLSLLQSRWQASLVDATTGMPVAVTPLLAPCQAISLSLRVAVPATAGSNDRAIIMVSARSLATPDTVVTKGVEIVAMRPWALGPNLPTPRYRLSATSVGCLLVSVGGLRDDDSTAALNSVELLNTTTGAWQKGADKPTSAGNCAMAALGGRVYVIGGYDEASTTKFLNVVEIYDPNADHWTAGVSLPVPLSGAAAAAWGDRIYVFGGTNANGASKTTYAFDAKTSRWSTVRSASVESLDFAGAVTVGQYVYVVGGWPRRAEVLRYDPATDTWASMAPLRVGRHSFALATLGGRVYVAGGGDSNDGLGSAERYDPSSDSWLTLPPLATSDRFGAAGAAVDGKFVVVGGADVAATPLVEYLDIDGALAGSRLTVDKPVLMVGDSARYALLLQNQRGQDLPVSWSHQIPEGLAYVEGSCTPGIHYDGRTGRLSWNGTLSPQAAVEFTFLGRVRPGVANETAITSTIWVDDDGCGPIALACQVRVSMPSLEASNKTVDKALAPPGATLHYTVTIANASRYTISNASLVDSVPTYSSVVSGSLTGGAVHNPSLRRIDWAGSLPPAEAEHSTVDWADATGGTKLPLTDDSCVGPLDLGFTFWFYGRPYTHIYVNSNGMILFEKCSWVYQNTDIPSPQEPNAFVAPMWDDLLPEGGGGIYLQVMGAAPHRVAVVEWHNVLVFGETRRQTFEALLYEGSNSVAFQYLSMAGERGAGRGATVGIESAGGTTGIEYLHDGAPREHELHDGLAVELGHSSTTKAAVHVISYDVRLDDVLPPLSIIANTAQISDGLATHIRTVTTTAHSAWFGTSRKQVAPTRARAGETLTYTLSIVNSGQLTATDVLVADVLPAALTYVTGTLSPADARYDPVQRQIQWRGALSPGAPALTIAFRALLTAALPANTWVTNTATVTERGTSMARLESAVLVNEVNLTASTKQAHAGAVFAGDPVTYTIAVRNTGQAIATQVVVTDVLPAAVALLPQSLSGGSYDAQQRAVRWQGPLGPGGEHVIRFSAQLASGSRNGTLVTNTASIASGSTPLVQVAAGVTAWREDLSQSVMTVSDRLVKPGSNVTVTLLLRNNGARKTQATLASGPVASLQWVPESLFASSGNLRLDDGDLHWSGELEPRSMVMIRYALLAPAGATPGTVILRATLTDGGGVATLLSTSAQIHGPTYFPFAGGTGGH